MTPDWMAAALCRHYPEIEFVPDNNAHRQIAVAKAVCAGCTVRRECLDYALDIGTVGVWGGTDDKQRRRMHRGGRRLNRETAA